MENIHAHAGKTVNYGFYASMTVDVDSATGIMNQVNERPIVANIEVKEIVSAVKGWNQNLFTGYGKKRAHFVSEKVSDYRELFK